MGNTNQQEGEYLPSPKSGNNKGKKSYGGEFVPIAEVSSISNKNSNFVFFFGKASSGKSTILASMLYHMNARAGSILPKYKTPNTKEAEFLLFDFLDFLSRGAFPYRTTANIVTRIDLIFEPNNKSKKIKPIELTFLEIAGDNHLEIRRGGAYHQSVDEYLNADIPLNIIMVTDYDHAREDDTLMFSFLNELERKGRQLKYINAILVIAKWDKSGSLTVSGPDQLKDFVYENMPMTNNQIDNHSLFKTFYTVGNTIIDEDGVERLDKLNLDTAKVLTDWLYETITGMDLNYEGTIWERLFGK